MRSPFVGNTIPIKKQTAVKLSSSATKSVNRSVELLSDRAEMHVQYIEKQNRNVYCWHCALLKINLRMQTTARRPITSKLIFNYTPEEIASLIKKRYKIHVQMIIAFDRLKSNARHELIFYYKIK